MECANRNRQTGFGVGLHHPGSRLTESGWRHDSQLMVAAVSKATVWGVVGSVLLAGGCVEVGRWP